MVSSDAAYMRRVSSRPYLEINSLTPSFSPVSTIPPLRELAPHPMVSDSSTTTLAPRFESARAAERPVKPAPMTATFTRSGSRRVGSVPGIFVVVNQKFCS